MTVSALFQLSSGILEARSATRWDNTHLRDGLDWTSGFAHLAVVRELSRV
jgi:hypothetical protein